MRTYRLSKEVHQEDLCTPNLLMDECTALEIGLMHLFVHHYLHGTDIYEHYKFNASENKAIKALFEKGFLVEYD